MRVRMIRLLASMMTTMFVLAAGPAQAEIDGSHPALCGHGCWVWIWWGNEFEGKNDVLCGPFKRTNMIKLPNANHLDWSEEINSMKMGPNATLRVWEDEAFEGYSRFYEAGTVKEKFNEWDDVEQVNSMELICMKTN